MKELFTCSTYLMVIKKIISISYSYGKVFGADEKETTYRWEEYIMWQVLVLFFTISKTLYLSSVYLIMFSCIDLVYLI